MHRRSSTRRARVLPVLVAAVGTAVALAGCSGPASSPGPVETTSEAPTFATDADPVVVESALLWLDVEATVGPVAVDGDLGVLRIEIEVTGGDDSLMVGEVFSNWVVSRNDTFDGVRLVDLDAGVVREAARTADGQSLASMEDNDVLSIHREPVVGYVAFDAPTGPTTGVLVPALGLVEDVPVVAAADAGGLTVAAAELSPSGLDGVVAHSAFVETFSTTADDAVRTRDTEDRVSISIDSDVLFDVDSAALSPAADEALIAAAGQLGLAADGELVVVGHTDSEGEEDANQVLSEQRAQAVVDRLGELADLTRFDVVVEGRGESEPVVTEDSDETRALNRRVTLEFVPADEPAVAVAPVPGDFPAAGPIIEGLGGATLDHEDAIGEIQTLHVELVDVRRAGAFLVGTLDVRNDGTDYATFISVLGSLVDGRGEYGTGYLGANNVTLLDGGVRIYPVDYLVDPDLYLDETRGVLADWSVSSLNPGSTSRVTVVWPDTGTDTVVVDVPDGSTDNTDGSTPIRFVDVPVAG